MPVRLNASTTILTVLLSACNAFGDDSISNSNASFDERYTALLLNSLKNKEAGTALEDAKMTDLTHLIQGVFQSNTTDEGQVSHVNVSIVGDYTTAEGKISHVNVSIVGDAGGHSSASKIAKFHVEGSVANASLAAQDNQTQVAGNMTNGTMEATKVEAKKTTSLRGAEVSKAKANKTKASAEVSKVEVASLPMASFALDDTPPKIKPDQKFPGNATQKAAWESKEKSLEKEVHALKARLENASGSLESSKHPVLPVAAGTFNANLHDGDSKAPKKFMVAKGPEPMQPIRKDHKPKADWPTMASVAEPVAMGPRRLNAVAAPPQQEAIQAQEGDGKRLVMGGAFTGTPAKKVESALAMDVTVDHDYIALDEKNSEQALSSSAVGWFSSLLSWFSAKPEVAAVPKPVAPSVAMLQKESAAFAWVKQDSAQTSQAVQEEHQRNFEVSDAWNQMEEEDNIREQKVRGEDVAERQRAAARETPRKPTKSEQKGRHGPELGEFWSQLEQQDHSIEQTVQSDDLVKYAQLTREQDTRVAKAGDELSDREIALHSSLKHNTDLRLAIHEPWLLREQKDKRLEREIHESKDLQMLQLRHSHQHK